MSSFFGDVDNLNMRGRSFAIKHGPDHSQQTTNYGPVNNAQDYSKSGTKYGNFNNSGQFIETNSGVNYYDPSNNQRSGRTHMQEQRPLRHAYEDYPPYLNDHVNDQWGSDGRSPHHGPPYPSRTLPPVGRSYSNHSDIYDGQDHEDHSHGYRTPASNPRTNKRPPLYPSQTPSVGRSDPNHNDIYADDDHGHLPRGYRTPEISPQANNKSERPSYPSRTLPPVGRYDSDHDDTYDDDGFEDLPHGYATPEISPRANNKSKRPPSRTLPPVGQYDSNHDDIHGGNDRVDFFHGYPTPGISPRAHTKSKRPPSRTLPPVDPNYDDIYGDDDRGHGHSIPEVSPLAIKKSKRRPPYPSRTFPPVGRHDSNYGDIYGDDNREDLPHGYPAPEISPRANDSVFGLQAETRQLSDLQVYSRNLERRVLKAADDLPDTLARMNLNDSDHSSPRPLENRDARLTRWQRASERSPPHKRPADYFSSNASYSTLSRSHSPDYESDGETPTSNIHIKSVDSNKITTEYISDSQNNETLKVVGQRKQINSTFFNRIAD